MYVNMKKSSVRWVFALVVVVFFAELALALNYTEPFPAIIYPSFSDIPSVNSAIQKPRIIVFFHDDDSVEISKQDFFHAMPDLYTNVILKENFNERNSFLATLKEVRALHATVGSKRIDFDLKKVGDEKHIEDGRTWIMETLQNQLQRDDLERVEVQWYDYNLTQNEEEPLEQGALVERFVVRLAN